VSEYSLMSLITPFNGCLNRRITPASFKASYCGFIHLTPFAGLPGLHNAAVVGKKPLRPQWRNGLVNVPRLSKRLYAIHMITKTKVIAASVPK